MVYPILAPNNTWYTQGGTTLSRSTFTEIKFVDSYTPTGEETESWDASANKDGSIMAYVNGTVLTVAGNGSGGISFNQDSKYVFNGITDGYYAADDFTNVTAINGLNIIDTSNVIDMRVMFYGCRSLQSLNINNWDTTNVNNMSLMFCSCPSLTELDLSNWDVSNVNSIFRMFESSTGLITINLSNWNTVNVTDASQMFNHCTALTTIIGLDTIDTSNVTSMYQMFNYCSSLTSLNISTWDVSKVTDFSAMFNNCSSLTSLDLNNWNTESATNMSSMFKACTSLKTLKASNWNTSNVTNMEGMFQSGSNYQINPMTITEIDVSKWDTSKVTNMSFMFYSCGRFKELDVSNWDVSSVKTFDHMFAHSSITCKVDTSKWVTSSAVNMNGIFHSVLNKVIDVSNFDTSNVQFFTQMFEYCQNVEQIIGLEKFDTSNGLDFQEMFSECRKLKRLNLANFNTKKAKDGVTCSSNGGKSATMKKMFYNTFCLEEIALGENFSFNGDGTTTTNACILPTPSSDHIEYATGVWYDRQGNTYSASEIPAGVKEVYYAVPELYRQVFIAKYGDFEKIANEVRGCINSDEKLTVSTMASELKGVNDKITELSTSLDDALYGVSTGGRTLQDCWWDFITTNGTKQNYSAFFRSNNFSTIGGFKPPYALRPVETADNMFRLVTGLGSVKKSQLDLSSCLAGNSVFEASDVKEIEEYNVSSYTVDIKWHLYGCSKLHTIGKYILKDNGSQTLLRNFINATNLQNIEIEGKLGCTEDFQSCSLLTAKSIESIVNSLYENASGQTLTFNKAVKTTYYNAHSTEYANADEAWNTLVATKPNWTISLV